MKKLFLATLLQFLTVIVFGQSNHHVSITGHTNVTGYGCHNGTVDLTLSSPGDPGAIENERGDAVFLWGYQSGYTWTDLSPGHHFFRDHYNLNNDTVGITITQPANSGFFTMTKTNPGPGCNNGSITITFHPNGSCWSSDNGLYYNLLVGCCSEGLSFSDKVVRNDLRAGTYFTYVQARAPYNSADTLLTIELNDATSSKGNVDVCSKTVTHSSNDCNVTEWSANVNGQAYGPFQNSDKSKPIEINPDILVNGGKVKWTITDNGGFTVTDSITFDSPSPAFCELQPFIIQNPRNGDFNGSIRVGFKFTAESGICAPKAPTNDGWRATIEGVTKYGAGDAPIDFDGIGAGVHHISATNFMLIFHEDGSKDTSFLCSNEATQELINQDIADFDHDGIADEFDPDDDNDGAQDENDAFPFEPHEQADFDGDGIGDNADADDDNDGDPDATDCGDNAPAFNSNTVWFQDMDGDGFAGESVTQCLQPIGNGWSITIPGHPEKDCKDDPAFDNNNSKAVTTHPGAIETCNLNDDDCNGFEDDVEIDKPTVAATDGEFLCEDVGSIHLLASNPALQCQNINGHWSVEASDPNAGIINELPFQTFDVFVTGFGPGDHTYHWHVTNGNPAMDFDTSITIHIAPALSLDGVVITSSIDGKTPIRVFPNGVSVMNLEICPGQSITFNATGGTLNDDGSYFWIDNIGSILFAGDTYTVTPTVTSVNYDIRIMTPVQTTGNACERTNQVTFAHVIILPNQNWYPDSDGDGFGDQNAVALIDCHAPTTILNPVTNNSDCNDNNPNINPNNPLTANAGADQKVCTNTSTLAATNPSAGQGAWSIISGTGNFSNIHSNTSGVTGLSAGDNIFQWTVTSGNCITFDDVTVNYGQITPFTIAANGPTTFCTGGSVILSPSLSVAGLSYQWKSPPGTTIPGSTNPSLTVTTTGNYQLVVRTANGCTLASGNSIVVTVGNNIAPTVNIAANGPTTFCPAGSVRLSVTNFVNGYAYNWFRGNTNIGSGSSILVNIGGNYKCQVSTTCGRANSNTISVSVQAINTSLNQTGSISICDGTVLGLQVANNPGYNYIWYRDGWPTSGGNSRNFDVTLPGSYFVIVYIPGSLCSATSQTVTVTINALPVVTVTPPGPINKCQRTTFTLNATANQNVNFQWKRDTRNVGNGGTTFSSATPGNYSVVATNQVTRCQGISNVVTVNNVCREEGVAGQSTFGESFIHLYPNPAIDKIHYEISSANESATLYLFNVIGQQMFFKSIQTDVNGEVEGDLDLSKLPAGIYLLQTETERGEVMQQKFVKE